MTSADPVEITPEAFADKIFTALLGTMETFSLYLGERLGWLAALAAEPLTAAELAEPDRHRRAVRASSGWRCRRSTATCRWSTTARRPGRRRYALPPAAAEVLTDEHSLSYLGALPRMFAAVGPHLEDLLAAYRSGRRGELGPARRRRPRVAGRHQPAVVRPRAGRRPWPACRRCTRCCPRPAAGSPTSAAARAGPASRWPAPIPEATVTGIDVDAAVGRRPADGRTPRQAGLADRVRLPRRRRRRARPSRTPSTRRSSSRRCTTCPGRSRCWPRSAPGGATGRPGRGHGRSGGGRVHRAG